MRRATLEDIPELVEMSRLFHAYSPWSDVDFDAEATGAFIRDVIMPIGAVFVSENGMVMGIPSPLHFNPALTIVVEIAWYAPKGGQDLRAALETWGREAGAYGIQCSALADSHSQAVGRLYRRAGYEPAETVYLKRLR